MIKDASNDNLIVIDIGKTNIKLHLLTVGLDCLESYSMSNNVLEGNRYPCIDTDGIWKWLIDIVGDISKRHVIASLCITTHGATAALIDCDSSDEDGLALPILDYEYEGIEIGSADYLDIKPDYSQTFSPNLPSGLNLGRQLFWLEKSFPNEFSKVTNILMYPQYWVWRFTEKLYTEITSLGCHTDLWSIEKNDYSSLVEGQQWRVLFPELVSAWHDVGSVSSKVSQILGLSKECHVYAGLHDSNASFLRYRLSQGSAPFTVISTGTWTILMSSNGTLEKLDPKKDMLANIDATGKPIACARFMGGREFEAICKLTGAKGADNFAESDIQEIINSSVYALPDFSQGSGPFGGQESKLIGDVNKVNGTALATLYCALMIDYQLNMLEAKGHVFIEGAFIKNPLLCALVQKLRPEQDVYLSSDSTGTVHGAAYTSFSRKKHCEINTHKTKDIQLTLLDLYKKQWINLVQSNNETLL